MAAWLLLRTQCPPIQMCRCCYSWPVLSCCRPCAGRQQWHCGHQAVSRPLLYHGRAFQWESMPTSLTAHLCHPLRCTVAIVSAKALAHPLPWLLSAGVVPACYLLDCVSVFALSVEDGAEVARLMENSDVAGERPRQEAVCVAAPNTALTGVCRAPWAKPCTLANGPCCILLPPPQTLHSASPTSPTWKSGTARGLPSALPCRARR